MPVYAFQCDKCGCEMEIFTQAAAKDRHRRRCPNCKSLMHRDYQAEFGRKRPANGTGWPMYSEALAVHPDQIADAERTAEERGVPTKFVKRDCPEEGAFAGQAIITSREHQRDFCRKVIGKDKEHGNIANYDDYW